MRARNLKPGFFRSAQVLECSPITRVLFAGLWCMADREGRLEDRPRQIQLEVLQADEVDVNALLNELVKAGLIARYSVNKQKLIQVIEFKRHQYPHKNEIASRLPPPPIDSSATPVQALERSSAYQVQTPVHVPESVQPRPEVARLTPSSLILNPSSHTLPRSDAREIAPNGGMRSGAGWMSAPSTPESVCVENDPETRKRIETAGREVGRFVGYLVTEHGVTPDMASVTVLRTKLAKYPTDQQRLIVSYAMLHREKKLTKAALVTAGVSADASQ